MHTLVTHCASAADLHPGERLRILHHVDHAEATRDAEDVRLRGRRERRGRRKRKAAVGRHGIERLADKLDRRIAQPRQHLRRPGQIELCDVRKQQKRDAHRGQLFGHRKPPDGRIHAQAIGGDRSSSPVVLHPSRQSLGRAQDSIARALRHSAASSRSAPPRSTETSRLTPCSIIVTPNSRCIRLIVTALWVTIR